MVWEYFSHFHKSALCYTDVHVYRATSHYLHALSRYVMVMTTGNFDKTILRLHIPGASINWQLTAAYRTSFFDLLRFYF